jgi:hypothetical protein
VGYAGLHKWLRKYLPIPSLCEMCNLRPHKVLANLTGVYDRNPANWMYMCDACHFKFDYDRGLHKNLFSDGTRTKQKLAIIAWWKKRNPSSYMKDMSARKCSVCSSTKTKMWTTKLNGLRPR